MSDLIDRKAAIDAIRKDMYADKDYMSALICDGIEDVLKSLPSAQPMMTNAADLINRGDAILAVYKRIKQLGMENDVDVLSIRQSIRDLASAQPYTEEEIQAMQDLEQAQLDKAYQIGVEEGLRSAQPQWIPCSERLPEEETTYLVTFASGQVGISSWHKSTKHNRGFDNVMQAVLEKGSITIYGVVAWMSLPEPWKGEQP